MIGRGLGLGGLLVAVLLLGGWFSGPASPLGDGFVPALIVEGDVEQVVRLDRASAEAMEWGSVETDGRTLPALPLQDIVKLAAPRAQGYRLLLVGSDGLSSVIDGADLTGANVAFSAAYGWECVNLNHPISSRIKMLAKIVVITADGETDPSATLIADADGSRPVTAGRMALLAREQLRAFEGRSEINGNYVEVYTPHERVALSDLMRFKSWVCAIGRDGELMYDRDAAGGALELQGNALAYQPERGDPLRDVAGVLADAPKYTIAEAATDAMHFLSSGERVLLIELDGWGWEMMAARPGAMPFLESMRPQAVLAAYPPISPVGLATILTGALPNEHGIHDRVGKQLSAPDLFEKAAALGVRCAYVEGDGALIKTSIAPVLSPDLNGENGTDDEVLDHALAHLDAGLLVVHFHGIDDVATTFGPESAETTARMALLDGYVKRLADAWDGRVIVTADHGLHSQNVEGDDRKGAHGIACAEDMLVPYGIR